MVPMAARHLPAWRADSARRYARRDHGRADRWGDLLARAARRSARQSTVVLLPALTRRVRDARVAVRHRCHGVLPAAEQGDVADELPYLVVGARARHLLVGGGEDAVAHHSHRHAA